MNQSKFSLADVLTVLAALAFGFVCFLGANFLNIGNDEVWGMPRTTGCIVIAVVCSVLLFATAFGAKLLKRTSRNFKTCFIWEVILLTLFVLFAVFFSTKTTPFPHFFTVTAQKSEINSKLRTSITQAENMFDAYEFYADNRKELYKNKLKSVVAAKRINPMEYEAYGFQNNGISDDKQIETKMFTVHADLFPTNYSDTTANNGTKEVATKWLQNAKNTTSNWKPIGIVGVVNDIEKNSTDWLNTLVTLSQVSEQGEQATDFEYPLSFDDVKTHFTKLDRPAPLSFGLALLAYILMLLSWFVTKRSTRFPGLKFLFGLGKSDEKEL
ncbi:hypothetical protein IH575_04600 [Candidatus Dojkabacteria bacterium]|nr:hypothetical protein [Candidatus Dojkabacteria bacterium]